MFQRSYSISFIYRWFDTLMKLPRYSNYWGPDCATALNMSQNGINLFLSFDLRPVQVNKFASHKHRALLSYHLSSPQLGIRQWHFAQKVYGYLDSVTIENMDLAGYVGLMSGFDVSKPGTQGKCKFHHNVWYSTVSLSYCIGLQTHTYNKLNMWDGMTAQNKKGTPKKK